MIVSMELPVLDAFSQLRSNYGAAKELRAIFEGASKSLLNVVCLVLGPSGSGKSALENIDEALKGANWVGVLQVANEMSREEDTDATDSDEEQPQVPVTEQRLNVVEEEESTEASPATMDEVWEELF
mgnify:CR=1 FL=1